MLPPKTSLAFLTLCLLLFCGCATSQEADVERLLALHEQQRTAHLNYDAELFAAMFHDPITQLNHGRISQQSRQETIERFGGYFGSVRFLEWEDIDPPVVRVSEDGSMAYVIVHKRVRLTVENEAGETEEEDTIFAWMEAWEKINSDWQLMAVASTDRPGDE
ncbi:MAG TPA: nuclear transport factor 2 family protein [Rhodothermales bacterium]|nr:nuclear transport factor 2 family protein [Rhodothermales bacterium]